MTLLIGLVLGVVGSLIASEVTEISPFFARRLVRWAAVRFAPAEERVIEYTEAWLAIVHERPGKLLKLITALGFVVGAVGRVVPRRFSVMTTESWAYLPVRLQAGWQELRLAIRELVIDAHDNLPSFIGLGVGVGVTTVALVFADVGFAGAAALSVFSTMLFSFLLRWFFRQAPRRARERAQRESARGD